MRSVLLELLLLLIVGMFLDPVVDIIILSMFFLPVAKQVGYVPWFYNPASE